MFPALTVVAEDPYRLTFCTVVPGVSVLVLLYELKLGNDSADGNVVEPFARKNALLTESNWVKLNVKPLTYRVAVWTEPPALVPVRLAMVPVPGVEYQP